MLEHLDSSHFMPHGHCFLWIKELLFLHVGADLFIALAYFTIPGALIYFSRHRPDVSLKPVFILFAAFITACGVSHLFGIWTMWHPDYLAYGIIKLITATVSVLTAIYIWKGMPQALLWPSPLQLRTTNEELRRENELHRQTHEALRESEVILRGAFDHAPIGKALVGLDGRWLRVNRALSRIVGYNKDELLATDFQSITYPDDLAADLQHVQDLLAGKSNGYEMEKRYIHKQGHLVWILLTATLVRNEQAEPQYFIAQIQDVTDRKRVERELRKINEELEARVAERTAKIEKINLQLAEVNLRLEKLARMDELTHLANRRYLFELMEKGMHASARYGVVLTAMMMDIDLFKSINDQYGHMMGDQVLSEVGRVIRQNIRDTDIAARIGGDEFCLVLVADTAQALVIGAKLREQIEVLRFAAQDKGEFGITCSIGLYQLLPGDTCIEQVISKADQALYAAKRAGRNQVFASGAVTG